MNKAINKSVTFLAIVVLTGIVSTMFLRLSGDKEKPAVEQETVVQEEVNQPSTPPAALPVSIPASYVVNDAEKTLHPSAPEMVADLHSPDEDPTGDLEIIQNLITVFRRANGKIPFGSENDEITAGLLGSNSKKLALLDRSHPSINDKGQLEDRWGTPYFFHPVSAKRLEVSSAGPDKKLFTEDDIHLDQPDPGLVETESTITE